MTEGVEVSKRELAGLVWELPITKLARRFGVSPNGLAKICDRLDIDRPPKGYWSGPEVRRVRPRLSATADDEEVIGIGGRRHGARRHQTRLDPDERRAQILNRANEIVLLEGVHQVSLRRVARDLGMSEAQAYNCFKTRFDLLVDLAMRELDIFSDRRADIVSRGTDRVAKVLLSTLLYLQTAAERGSSAVRLMALAEVRNEVDARRRARDAKVRENQVEQIIEDRGISDAQAKIDASLLGNLTLRAGGLVARGRLSITDAQMMIMPPIIRRATSRAG